MLDDAFPGGSPVTFEVACRTSRRGRSTRRHPVTIAPDWSVTTPHDLELERVAAALGGYLFCLELVDRYVPALRELWLRRRRVVAPEVRRAGPAAWVVTAPVTGCSCGARTFRTPALAAEHVRGAPHWALTQDVHAATLQTVAEAFAAAAGPVRRAAEAARAAGRQELEWLWDAGVHPARVAEIHAGLGASGRLPVQVVHAVATGEVELGWLRQFVGFGPGVMSWAATTFVEGEAGGARRHWLEVGA
ncbi:hypothetical protein, partial [Cellulomonas composti]|uniref:hypothetical protein n=1 Tax=Cellulomonas composti TaxID=266130 RepID=UPI0011BEAD18